MMNRELREWLGLTLADLVGYIALAAAGAMFMVKDAMADVVLAVAGVVLSITSCPLGMKPDPEVSEFTNCVKLVSYPICVLLVVGAIVAHYIWFSG
ncbi:MAG: hypothetical protein H7144_08660 [Burkholderiales bacterium]|nr:hypothetical protein [Phycisphaerae bacterium]